MPRLSYLVELHSGENIVRLVTKHGQERPFGGTEWAAVELDSANPLAERFS
jgi:hypothetical protein